MRRKRELAVYPLRLRRAAYLAGQQADDFLKGLRNGIADNHLTLVVATYHAEHAGDGFQRRGCR